MSHSSEHWTRILEKGGGGPSRNTHGRHNAARDETPQNTPAGKTRATIRAHLAKLVTRQTPRGNSANLGRPPNRKRRGKASPFMG